MENCLFFIFGYGVLLEREFLLLVFILGSILIFERIGHLKLKAFCFIFAMCLSMSDMECSLLIFSHLLFGINLLSLSFLFCFHLCIAEKLALEEVEKGDFEIFILEEEVEELVFSQRKDLPFHMCW